MPQRRASLRHAPVMRCRAPNGQHWQWQRTFTTSCELRRLPYAPLKMSCSRPSGRQSPPSIFTDLSAAHGLALNSSRTPFLVSVGSTSTDANWPV